MINRNLLGRGYATACVEVMKLVILVKILKLMTLSKILKIVNFDISADIS